MNAWADSLHKVLEYQKQLPEDQQGAFVEAVRRLSITAKAEFRRDQKRGSFTDKTGDLAITSMLATLGGK